jgi:hypothetical protein
MTAGQVILRTWWGRIRTADRPPHVEHHAVQAGRVHMEL